MLKYKSADTFKLIDAFVMLSEKGVEGLPEAMQTLTNYPPKVIQTFLDTIESIQDKHIKENYIGLIGLITLRLNFAENENNNLNEKE